MRNDRIAREAPLQLFKVQRPLYSSDGELHQILIYNEKRDIECTIKVGYDTIVSLFFLHNPVGVYKTFVLATSDKRGRLQIEKVLTEEEFPSW